MRRDLAEHDPLEARKLERLHQVAQLRGNADLVEVTGQLLGALGLPSERARPRDLARALSGAELDELMGGSAGLIAEVWPLLAEAAARVEGLELGQFGGSRHTRIAPGGEPRLQWLEAAARGVGLPELTLHLGGTDNLTVVALDEPEPTLIVGRGVLAGDPASRFRAGRALYLLRKRAATVERLPTAQLDEILWAAAVLSGARPPGVDATALKARAKAVGKAMGRRELKALEDYQARIDAESLDGHAWRAAVVRGADRFGLLVSGDAGAAVRVLAGRPDAGLVDLRRPESLELIRFALGDRYAALRRQIGVAGSAGEP